CLADPVRVPRILAGALQLQVVKCRTRSEVVRELDDLSPETAIVRYIDHHGDVLTVPRDHLRAFGVRGANELAEALLSVLNLPPHGACLYLDCLDRIAPLAFDSYQAPGACPGPSLDGEDYVGDLDDRDDLAALGQAELADRPHGDGGDQAHPIGMKFHV